MKAKTFDRKFDAGEQILDQLDLSKARRHRCEAGQNGFSRMDGWLTRPGSSPFRCDAAVAHQVVACRKTSSLMANLGSGTGYLSRF